MYINVNKAQSFFLNLIIVCFFIGCKQNKEKYLEIYSKQCDKVLRDKIFYQMKDSLIKWYSSKLAYANWDPSSYENSWTLDTMLFFNKKKTKVFTFIINRHLTGNTDADIIRFFQGEILNGEWYFYENAEMVISRKRYTKEVNKPLPMKKLLEIGRQYILPQYYISKSTEDYEINEDFFKTQFEGNGWMPYKDKAELDAIKLQKVRNNWANKLKPNS
jgi:hypothetical protein